MTNEEYINQIIEIGNTLQIQPNSPKGQTLKKCIELLSVDVISIDQANAMIKSYVSHYEENEELRENIEKVKAEIKKNILDEPIENGTNAEMACYNGGLLKGLEIIDKHIGKAESEDKK